MGLKTNKKLLQILILTGIATLSGCAAQVTEPNVSDDNKRYMAKIDDESHDLIQDRLKIESQKLFTQNMQLQQELIKLKEKTIEPEVVAPEFNPLDSVNVSINVSNGDAQHILHVLAEQAKLSLLVDPDLAEMNRKMTMHLKDVPASQVFDNVMRLLDLHGEVDGNMMIVRPFEEKVFSLNFLQSGGTLDFNMGGDVFGANNSLAGDGGGSNSMSGNLSISGAGATEVDPYEKLSDMLEDVIGSQESGSDNDSIPGVAPAEDEEQKGPQSIYSLNELTGTLYLKARPSQVKAVSSLVQSYKDVLSRQVLIEAQILDISLTEEFKYGVDWSILRNKIAGGYGGSPAIVGDVSGTIPDGNAGLTAITIPAKVLGFAANPALGLIMATDTFSASVDMMKGFGNVRVLSNPSVRAKNARPSFISVGQSSQIIAKASTTVNNTGGGAVTTTSEITTGSVFNGVILGFEPFIDDDGTIHLSIHPMQSEVDKSSLELIDVGGGTKVTLPVVDFKGLTTSLSLNDGDTVILGGLIDEKSNVAGEGVPGLTDVPGLGGAFGGRANAKQTREMVIVLKVTRL